MVSAINTESLKFEKASNKLNIGESLNEVFTGYIDDDDFPNFLKDNPAGPYRYEQKIGIGDLVLQNFSDSDYNDREQTIGLHIPPNALVLNYYIDFIQDPSFNSLEQQQIYFLGKSYLIIDADSSQNRITLQDNENNILILGSGSEIKFNGEYIDGVSAVLNKISSSLDKITLTWKTDDESFVAEGTDLKLPILEVLGLRFEGLSEIGGEVVGNMYLDALYEEEDGCVDSDNGNYYVKGTTTHGEVIGYDICTSNTLLSESKCVLSGLEHDIIHEDYVCPNGCKDGACIKECEDGLKLCPEGICRDECEEVPLDECKFGCISEDKCLPIGTRAKGSFCSIEINMEEQLGKDSSCENNFECKSNVCVAGECLSQSFIQKILNWFARLFGG